jgi:hypothetical protein
MKRTRKDASIKNATTVPTQFVEDDANNFNTEFDVFQPIHIPFC